MGNEVAAEDIIAGCMPATPFKLGNTDNMTYYLLTKNSPFVIIDNSGKYSYNIIFPKTLSTVPPIQINKTYIANIPDDCNIRVWSKPAQLANGLNIPWCKYCPACETEQMVFDKSIIGCDILSALNSGARSGFKQLITVDADKMGAEDLLILCVVNS